MVKHMQGYRKGQFATRQALSSIHAARKEIGRLPALKAKWRHVPEAIAEIDALEGRLREYVGRMEQDAPRKKK